MQMALKIHQHSGHSLTGRTVEKLRNVRAVERLHANDDDTERVNGRERRASLLLVRRDDDGVQ